MILALNWFTLLLAVLVSLSLIISNYKRADTMYRILSAIMLIPVFAQIRQILVLTDFIYYLPAYLFLVYFLLRLVGPLINWHTHLQFDKKFNFFSVLNVVTYLLLIYTVYFMMSVFFSDNFSVKGIVATFSENSFYSMSYPVVQLLHVGQAAYLIFTDRTKSGRLINFMKVGITTVFLMLVTLQISYFILDRPQVELIVAPIFFIIIYSSILVVSIKYSNVFINDNDTIAKNVRVDFLSERENEVLIKLAEGKTDKEIADELNLSVYTIATYCRRLYGKLEVKNRTEAANYYNNLAKS